MLCTACSQKVKPVVAIDIDGTLGDYHAHFLRFASAYLGFELPGDYTGKSSFKSWFIRTTTSDEHTWNDIKLAYRQGAQKRSMPMYADADRLCEQVIDAGAELWLTTTRPYLRLDNVDPDTRFWLQYRGIPYHHLLYDEVKYRVLADRVGAERVAAVLDDLPDMWSEAASIFGWRVPILRQTRWNQSVSGEGAPNLRDAWILIERRINEWRQHNG